MMVIFAYTGHKTQSCRSSGKRGSRNTIFIFVIIILFIPPQDVPSGVTCGGGSSTPFAVSEKTVEKARPGVVR